MGLFDKKKNVVDTDVNEDGVSTAHTETTESDDAAKSGGMKALFNRGGRARKEKNKTPAGNKALKKDERLASVIGESTAGPAVELVRANERFAVRNEDGEILGWTILVLPTMDESFGGLNRKQRKNEDKGAIINLIVNDDIEVIETLELLDQDALGLIPSAKSFSRTDEFSILAGARYFYGIVAIDPITGDPVVFTVPPVKEESSTGHIYPEAKKVLQGQLDIDEVVDPALVETMVRIFHEKTEPGSEVEYGVEGVLDAMDFTMFFIAESKQEGRYPTSEEIIDNLYAYFPALSDGESTGRHAKKDDDKTDESIEQGTAVAVGAADDDLDDGDVNSAANDNEDDEEDVQQSSVAADNEQSEQSEEPAQPEETEELFGSNDSDGSDDFDEIESSNEASHNESWEPQAGYAPAAQQGVALSPDQFERLMGSMREIAQSTTQENFDVLRQDINAHMAQSPQTFAQSWGVDNREFSHEDVNNAAVERFQDDELGLFVQTDLFNQRLTFMPYQVEPGIVDDMAATPWLGNQLESLRDHYNAQLMDLRQRNYESLVLMFNELDSKAIEDIKFAVSVDNDESEFGMVRKVIDSDRVTMQAEHAGLISRRRAELEANYAKDRETYVQRSAERERENYDRRYKSRLDEALRNVDNEYREKEDRVTEDALAQLNDYRRRRAHIVHDSQLRVIMENLAPMLDDHKAMEKKAYEEAQEALKNFYESNRADDLRWATVTEEKLASDTRVEQANRDAEERVRAVREDADRRMAEKQEQIEQLNENFRAELARRDTIAEAQLEHSNKEIATAKQQMREAMERYQQRTAEIEQDAKDRIRRSEEAATQARTDSDYFIESQKSDNTITIVIMVVLSIVMLVAGMLAGVMFF